MDFTTKIVHGNVERKDQTGAISFPVYQSATFAHPSVGNSTGYDYSRLQNPTREQLEKLVASLEGGVDAMAFSSGMAAITTLMELFSPGDHLIVSDDTYGGTHRLFSHISVKNGLTFDFVNTSDLGLTAEQIRPETKAIYIETPTNPMMKVTDLAGVAQLARKHGLLLIVDNTFLTPYFQLPIPLGADIVLHSGTKYLGGHNDVLAGFLVAAKEELAERLRFLSKTTGACLAPMDCWLMIRGMKTLALRMEKQQENALTLAHWLLEQPKVRKIYYVGLPSHPDYAVSQKQASGFGGMISFEVDCAQTAEQILERVRLIQFAESLGGVESLITYPVMQTHADVPEEHREAVGINNRLLRLSVGIESAKDLMEDLKQAMEGS